jgi:hypothetical protein
MASSPNTQPVQTPLDTAADFIERVYTRAATTKYINNLGLWINPDETKGSEYVTVRDSVLSDVIQNSPLYIPGVEAKRKYYKAQLDVFIPALEAASRAWAIDDLTAQTKRLVPLLLAVKAQDSRLHAAAVDVKKLVNAGNFVLPSLTADQIREITNESRRGKGTVQTRLKRMEYMYAVQKARAPKRGEKPVNAAAKPAAPWEDAGEYLFYLMAHPQGVQIMDAFAKSSSDGWNAASGIITDSLKAIVKIQADLNGDKVMIWRLTPAVSAGVAQLGFAKRPALTRFSLAWASTVKSWIESAIETAMNAIFILDIIGGPVGAEVAGVLNFVLAAIGTAVSFLRDAEQDQAASATAFAGKNEKLSEGSRGIGTVLQGVATIVAATALPGTLSRVTGGLSRTAEKLAEAAEHAPPARPGITQRGLPDALAGGSAAAAERRAVNDSIRAAEPEAQAAQRGLPPERTGMTPELQQNIEQRGIPLDETPASPPPLQTPAQQVDELTRQARPDWAAREPSKTPLPKTTRTDSRPLTEQANAPTTAQRGASKAEKDLATAEESAAARGLKDNLAPPAGVDTVPARPPRQALRENLEARVARAHERLMEAQRDMDKLQKELKAVNQRIKEAPKGQNAELARLNSRRQELIEEVNSIGDRLDLSRDLLEARRLLNGTERDYFEALTGAASGRRQYLAVRARGLDEVFHTTGLALEVEHIFPRSRLFELPGFERLGWEDQVALFNYEPNLVVMPRLANGARGNIPYRSWPSSRWPPFVDAAAVARMAQREADLEAVFLGMLRNPRLIPRPN